MSLPQRLIMPICSTTNRDRRGDRRYVRPARYPYQEATPTFMSRPLVDAETSRMSAANFSKLRSTSMPAVTLKQAANSTTSCSVPA